MARIAGVEIPNNKRSEIALTYIFGIGRSSAQEILKKAGVNFDTKIKDLPEEELDKFAVSDDFALYEKVLDLYEL